MTLCQTLGQYLESILRDLGLQPSGLTPVSPHHYGKILAKDLVIFELISESDETFMEITLESNKVYILIEWYFMVDLLELDYQSYFRELRLEDPDCFKYLAKLIKNFKN